MAPRKSVNFMEQNAINEIAQWLPEIDPCQIDLTSGPSDNEYHKQLTSITEDIHAWAISILEKASLPIASNEVNTLIDKYDISSDEGCALHVLVELDAMRTSLKQTDANTAVITGMKVFEAIWKRAIAKIHQTTPQEEDRGPIHESTNEINEVGSEENIVLYQETIDELNKKYPHCSINALRLLASTRLNVTKQQLDDLGISPQ